MGLAEYKRKRSLRKTKEPAGGQPTDEKLHFVIHKHAASSLHYDFRLELKGVLKSWAVPKGPSLNPTQKRLAMQVEDHPYGYKDFEGIIPEGNYGAGAVIIWDEGTYEPVESADAKRKSSEQKTEQEKILLKGFRSGSFKIKMKGKKLKGEFALVKMASRGNNAWLIIKQKDKYASDNDITEKDRSVVSRKTIEQLASERNKDNTKSNPKAERKSKATSKTSHTKTALKRKTTGRLKTKKNDLFDQEQETQVKKIDGHELKFTHLSKVFWPDEKITKRDMLNYYDQVAPYILLYLKDRPQTLNRHPNGIKGGSFFQKDVTGKVPAWVEKHSYFAEGDAREKHFLVCTDEASLLYMASLGCIEMNPWSSRTQTPDHPDWCIIDLDPDNNPFDEVIEAAQITKQVLDEGGVPSYCKTSGSTGIHIYLPLGAKYDYENSKEFARAIVNIVHTQLPKTTSIERVTAKRKGKIYLDFLQNRPQATVAAPYSLRPKPHAPVSMPLPWEELKKGLMITDFTIRNAIAQIKEQGDIFKGVLGKGVNIQKALKKLEESFKEASSP